MEDITDLASKGPRFPPDGQTDEQKAALAEAERLVKLVYGENFQLKDSEGNLLGPFGILSYASNTLLPYLNYSQSYVTLPTITAKERELCVLATVSVTKSAYIEYAHKQIGISVGLTQDQVDRASKGRTPEGLTDREEFVYELAVNMAKDFGVIKDKDFNSAVSVLGKDGVSQVAQMVGGYMLSSVLVTVADVPVPQS